MPEVLEVEQRAARGKLNNRRLRTGGKLPAVLYGHGQEPVSLAVPADQLDATLRHGGHLVELQGAVAGQAFLQDVQWDTFQQHVLHVDLLRVDASDRVKVELPVLLRGEAPGASEGGIVDQLLHRIEIETSAVSIPDNLHLSINALHLGGLLKSEDIEDLPPGAKVLTDASAVLVQCIESVVVEEEEDTAAAGSAEPEVIGQKGTESPAEEG